MNDKVRQGIGSQDPNLGQVDNPQGHEGDPPGGNDYQPQNKWEERALAMGWKPKEDWHGDDEDWTPAREYVRVGEVLESNRRLQSRIDRNEADFNSRLDSVQEFHRNQLQMQRENLEAKRDKAAEDGDMEDYREANAEIKKLDEQQTTTQQQPTTGIPITETPEVKAYLQSNPWIAGNDPKAVFARQKFIDFIEANKTNQQATVADALNYMENQVNEFYPGQNEDPNNVDPRRRASMGDKGGGPAPRGKSTRALAWEDLTKEEVGMYNKFYKGQDKEKFLKTVADCRQADREAARG